MEFSDSEALGWRPVTLEIEGLFGQVSHKIAIAKGGPVTIIAGPNGCGKTHALKLLRAVLAVDFNDLLSMPFNKIRVALSNGSIVSAERREDGGTVYLDFEMRGPSGVIERFSVNSDEFDFDESDDLPPWMHRQANGRWYDARVERYLSAREIERRYGVSVSTGTQRQNLIDQHEILQSLSILSAPTLIDTKRLDTPLRTNVREDPVAFPGGPGSGGKVGRIGQYIAQIRQQVSEARRESLSRSQDADEKFASNLLKRSKKLVRQEDLVAEYERLSKLSEELSLNALAGKAVSVKIPPNADETERRVLELFLQDWERKLEPLLPVHRKLTALKRIVDDKFIGKTIRLDVRGGLHFRSSLGGEVRVDQLSSGEQHLLALFTLLIFSANSGSVVLIDEPEISLHAAWKHSFVSDIEEVARLNDLTVILATHSTAIINGRWDIVQEIGVVEER
ncbi:ATP-binding protein [Sanguibacter sp. 4.1]|uniref:ATP-binding protein n=1 Tax=Sanguibacter biliveldensis TaxID=3030830 RepID=A0AAF1C164_9MICO|nr:ATP-binding protein [Sanguibacter sp. 4.1]WPF80720.1 ATP-binding protein [Sanguibacter sp. 4.1]